MRARGIRQATITAAVAICAATAAVVAGGSVPATVRTTHNAALGSILVNSGGRTLYHYLGDRGKTIACTGGCAGEWPPLLIGAAAKPVGGAGIQTSKLGSIRRPDGGIQVTYNGLPLYRFAGDAKAGEVEGQGEEGRWFAVAPSGSVVRTSLPAAAPAASGSSGQSSSSGSASSSSAGSGSAGSGGGSMTTPATSDPGYGYG